VQYLEAHSEERERRLNEDGYLRSRYFQAHADAAASYYNHHPEFRAEFDSSGRRMRRFSNVNKQICSGRKREVGRWNRF